MNAKSQTLEKERERLSPSDRARFDFTVSDIFEVKSTSLQGHGPTKVGQMIADAERQLNNEKFAGALAALQDVHLFCAQPASKLCNDYFVLSNFGKQLEPMTELIRGVRIALWSEALLRGPQFDKEQCGSKIRELVRWASIAHGGCCTSDDAEPRSRSLSGYRRCGYSS